MGLSKRHENRVNQKLFLWFFFWLKQLKSHSKDPNCLFNIFSKTLNWRVLRRSILQLSYTNTLLLDYHSLVSFNIAFYKIFPHIWSWPELWLPLKSFPSAIWFLACSDSLQIITWLKDKLISLLEFNQKITVLFSIPLISKVISWQCLGAVHKWRHSFLGVLHGILY